MALFFSKDEIDTTSKILYSGKVNYWTGNDKIIRERILRVFIVSFQLQQLMDHLLYPQLIKV